MGCNTLDILSRTLNFYILYQNMPILSKWKDTVKDFMCKSENMAFFFFFFAQEAIPNENSLNNRICHSISYNYCSR